MGLRLTEGIDLKRWRAGECRLVQLPAISTEGLTRDDAKRLADEVQALMAAQIDQMDADIAQGR